MGPLTDIPFWKLQYQLMHQLRKVHRSDDAMHLPLRHWNLFFLHGILCTSTFLPLLKSTLLLQQEQAHQEPQPLLCSLLQWTESQTSQFQYQSQQELLQAQSLQHTPFARDHMDVPCRIFCRPNECLP